MSSDLRVLKRFSSVVQGKKSIIMRVFSLSHASSVAGKTEPRLDLICRSTNILSWALCSQFRASSATKSSAKSSRAEWASFTKPSSTARGLRQAHRDQGHSADLRQSEDVHREL